ncbi:MAG: hypothetical protein ACI892_002119, partial [Marinobacter maritimus]
MPLVTSVNSHSIAVMLLTLLAEKNSFGNVQSFYYCGFDG